MSHIRLAELVALVNSDAVVAPGALACLAEALEDEEVGLATSSLRLHEHPELMNSAGNPIHYLGLSWAGAMGEPAREHAHRAAWQCLRSCVAFRREVWDQLGGFWEEMFAYCEDAELSLRCWQSGRRVVYVPDAVVTHHYEFSRNPRKAYLLERNRLLLLLTLYERRTLWLLMPAMLGLEVVGLAVAMNQGWARDKARGWWWLLRHRRLVVARRRFAQSSRTCSDRSLARLLTPDFEPAAEVGVHAPWILTLVSRAYWSLVKRMLAR